MSYFDRLLTRATRGAAKAAPAPPGRLRARDSQAERWDLPDASTAERQARLYANLAWIQTAVANVANVFAATPLRVGRLRVGEEPERLPGHPFELLLRRPNPNMSRFEFLEATYAWRRITGNAYWWLNRASEAAPPEELWIIPAHQVTPIPDGYGHVAGYRYDPGDGAPIPLQTWEVAHFKTFNPLSRYVGLSAVQALAIDSAADLAGQRYNAAFYDKDNAKPDGLLMFADDIEEGAWRRLQADLNDQAGGTKRKRIMMLRNVGAGGVQWAMTHVSRAEQQFLEVRTFTKEEIFATLAPGLASILAVNATEANSSAGKDTFLTMAVYPQQVAVAEKINNDVLPAWGEDLTAAFEDVRRVDTAVELAARTAYERTHTVDEVRARYDGDGPIGDERGALLPSQAAAYTPPAAAPPSAELIAAAAKALDRRRWQQKAAKALAAGRAADVPFDPDALSEDEAMVIRAALRRASSAADLDAAFRVEG